MADDSVATLAAEIAALIAVTMEYIELARDAAALMVAMQESTT